MILIRDAYDVVTVFAALLLSTRAVTLRAIRPRNVLQKITNNHIWLSIRELLLEKNNT